MTLVGVVAGVTLDTAGTWATLTSCWELRGGLGVGIVGGDGHDFLVARITLIPRWQPVIWGTKDSSIWGHPLI